MKVQSQFIEMININTKNVSLDKIVEYIGKGITPKYVEKSDVAVINQACVYWEGLNLDNVKYHNNKIKCNKNYLENGDVLINATGTGTLGRSCIYNVPKNGLAYINDGHVIVIKTKNDIICPEILSMYFSLADTQSEIYRQYVTGSTNQVDIVLTKFRKMSIPIPDYVKQSKFVLIKQQADKSKFGEFKSQFIEMFGCINKRDLLKNHCSICSGKSIPTKDEEEVGNIAYVKVADFNLLGNEKYIQTSSKFVSERASALSKRINKGCIIFAKNGAASLSNKKRLTNIECCIDMNTMSVECFDDMLLPMFLFSVFESINIASYVRQGAIPSINPNDIGSIEIPIPSISFQNEFITIVEQADKSKSIYLSKVA